LLKRFTKYTVGVVLGLLLLIVVIMIMAPSQLMESQLKSNVNGLEITSSEGGFWSGEVNGVRLQKHSIEKLSWQLSGSTLLTANLGADLKIEDPLFSGSLFAQQSISGRTHISELNGIQTVSELSRIWPMIRFVSPTGELDWNEVAIAFDNERFDLASGSVKWNNAELLINNQLVALGEVVASLDVENDDLVITLISDDKFDLQASIIVSRNNQYKITASIKEDIPTNIYNAVRFMARSDGNGRFVLNNSGRW
jgi:hypothetical protein